MLRVKTKIGPSGIHGTGLFADEFIKAGTVTWQYDPGYDVALSVDQFNSLPQLSKDFFHFYCYFDKERKVFILPTDHLRFINHSKDPAKINISSTPDKDIAAKDIQAGEEMLCDYFMFDPEYFARHGLDNNELI